MSQAERSLGMHPAAATSGGREVMPGFERLLQHGSTLLVGASGVVYAWMRYLLPESEDPFTVARHPLQPTFLEVHVLAGPLFLLALGMIFRSHILARLRNSRRRRSRRSGWAATLLLVPMIASGYLLQTATSEGWRWGLLVAHLGSGGLFLGTYLLHLGAAMLGSRRRDHRPSQLAGPAAF